MTVFRITTTNRKAIEICAKILYISIILYHLTFIPTHPKYILSNSIFPTGANFIRSLSLGKTWFRKARWWIGSKNNSRQKIYIRTRRPSIKCLVFCYRVSFRQRRVGRYIEPKHGNLFISNVTFKVKIYLWTIILFC